MPALTIVPIVVNYRSTDLVFDLLQSIYQSNASYLNKLVVVDNGSGDDSFEQLKAIIRRLRIEDRVYVLDTGRNAGFGAGNNFGAKEICRYLPKPDILWLLNPDTLVNQTNLSEALRWFDTDPSVGIVGTGMVDEAGKRSLAGHRDLSPIGEFIGAAGAFRVLNRWSVSDPSLDRPGPVDWVSGASLLIRTEVFEELAGFDEGFFLYFEEVDLCRRARRAGWKVIYEPRTSILHLEGKTTGVQKSQPMPRYWYESRRRFFLKHNGRRGLLAADLCWTFGFLIGSLRRRKLPSYRLGEILRCDLPALLGLKTIKVNLAQR